LNRQASKRAQKKRRQTCHTFSRTVREFLTPAVLKQVHTVCSCRRKRWNPQPVLMVLLTMTWCGGDSLPEKFEAARGYYVACHVKRRRPGETLAGFQKALDKLPMRALRIVVAAIRRELLSRLGDRLRTHGWLVFGCDGSRVECPRSVELERRLGQAGRDKSAPSIWVTAIVHLRSGLLWSWRIGKGTASEQRHLVELLPTLPTLLDVLLVMDAAYQGYQLALDIMGVKASFLARVCSKTWLYQDEETPLESFREGLVYYWPQDRQKAGQPPLQLRLIRIRSEDRKYDVWLLTNVLDAKRLNSETAGRFYRWRWENEGLFRTYKRTMGKVKLQCRTVAQVHREAEGSLLAVQLMLAQAAVKLHPCGNLHDKPLAPSAGKVLREIRREIRENHQPLRRKAYSRRLRQACREHRDRQTPKVTRVWPARKNHKPPLPPRLLTLTSDQKALRDKLLQCA
jgi:hypothetical protein